MGAHEAGLACLSEEYQAGNDGLYLIPMPRHLASVAIVGVARLRYRPRTTMTAAWYGKAKGDAEKWEQIYAEIVSRGGRSLQGLMAA